MNPASPFRALRHRNFRIFFAGMSASLIGTWMQNVAQSWLLYRLTHSELLLGMSGFLTHVPTLLLGPIAGVVADRYERRKIVIVAQCLFLVQAALLAVLTLTETVTVGYVLVLAAFQGIVDAFDRPARQSMLIHLAAREDLLSAISLNSVMFNVARILGPSLGGITVAAFGEGLTFSINAISFLAVIGSLLILRLPEMELNLDKRPLEHLAEGFRYVASSPKVWPLLGIAFAVNIAIAPMFVLLPFFADALFRQGSQGLGFLTGALGVGAIVGTLVLARRPTMEGLPRVIFASTLMLAVTMAVFAWAPAFWFSLVVMLLVGFSLMRQNTSTNTQVQTQIDEAFRGRVMGMYSTAVIGGLPIGSLAGGALAQWIGARWTIFLCAVLCGVSALLFRERSDV